jgi:aspartyl-tRNA(Asn)/glutamyl-tRNA(Gln) amidotransferase subunit B
MWTAYYKGGKESALQFLVGQVMKETKGSANPQIIKQLLLDLLK